MDTEEKHTASDIYNDTLLKLYQSVDRTQLSTEEKCLLSNYLTVLPKYYLGREYHLRVDYEDVDHKKMRDFMLEIEDDVIFAYAYHEGGPGTEKKSHYHMHIVFKVVPDKSDVQKKRVTYKRYWNRSGSSFSFVADKGKSRFYVTKEGKMVCWSGEITNIPESLSIYQWLSYNPEEQMKARKELKKKKKASGKSPMQIMYECFQDRVTDLVLEYNATHLDKRDESYYQTDRYLASYVQEYYATIVHKSFGVQRMAEALLYLRYRVKGFSFENPDDVVTEQILRKAFNY